MLGQCLFPPSCGSQSTVMGVDSTVTHSHGLSDYCQGGQVQGESLGLGRGFVPPTLGEWRARASADVVSSLCEINTFLAEPSLPRRVS